MSRSKKSLRRSMHRCDTTKTCRICKLHGSETFNFLKRSFVFDVDKARRITQDGRQPVEVDRDDVLHAVDTARIYIEHVPHVRVEHPGIIARMRVHGADGSTMEGDLLIDGHHRAAKCLQLGVPYRAYLLTVEETDRVLKRRPDADQSKKSAKKAKAKSKKSARAAVKTQARRDPSRSAAVAKKPRRDAVRRRRKTTAV